MLLWLEVPKLVTSTGQGKVLDYYEGDYEKSLFAFMHKCSLVLFFICRHEEFHSEFRFHTSWFRSYCPFDLMNNSIQGQMALQSISRFVVGAKWFVCLWVSACVPAEILLHTCGAHPCSPPPQKNAFLSFSLYSLHHEIHTLACMHTRTKQAHTHWLIII